MNYPLSRQQNIVIQETGQEILLYDLEKNKVYCLNQTSAMIWNICDGKKSIGEIVQFSGLPAEVVWLALDQLKDEKLIQNYGGSSSYFNNLSRREIIKKVGLASLVSLPLISAIIAPKAANAASGADPCAVSPGFFPNGCVCLFDPDCLSGCCKKIVGLTGTCQAKVGGVCP